MAVLQPLIDLVELCRMHGVTQAVISPGSRSAALTLALARNPHIHCTVVMDERAAGFIALGMAQQLGKPVILVCTSGSAAYNFAPAVAEAFFQHIPLLVLTADRPNEWIHQNDGQTIYQAGLYGRHVKGAYELPADYSHPDSVWYINRTVNEALLTTLAQPSGPVHINVPIREPFYPQEKERLLPSRNIRKVDRVESQLTLSPEVWHRLLDEWEDTEKILVAVGQYPPGSELPGILAKLTEEFQIPVLGESLANLKVHELSLSRQDLILASSDTSHLQTDLLITVGQSFISKNFKKFIRQNPPRYHWHISEELHLIDSFQTITRQIIVSPEYFFAKLIEDLDYIHFVQHDEGGQDEAYLGKWLKAENQMKRQFARLFENLTTFSDLTVVRYLLNYIPSPAQLHVANSMPVRYVTMLGIDREGIGIYANRGTSGIDGCVSTAVGAAMISHVPVYLLVGDVAFLYDRNGLLLSELPSNLKIILLNNAGGTIFRLIDGPATQPELESYFETRHGYTAQRTAADSGIRYCVVETEEELQNQWHLFEKENGPALLEIKTDPVADAQVFRQFKEWILGETE
jgi:2-succinyl-5-enolpyruvyl-6-hydroxy-3-cyclohexene-1-carboxylate synthase